MTKEQFTERFTTPSYPNGDLTLVVVALIKAESVRDDALTALQKVVVAWDKSEWLDENDFEQFRKILAQ